MIFRLPLPVQAATQLEEVLELVEETIIGTSMVMIAGAIPGVPRNLAVRKPTASCLETQKPLLFLLGCGDQVIWESTNSSFGSSKGTDRTQETC